MRNPGGILLITPESREALLVRRGTEIGRLFGATRAVVLDELHSVLDSARGVQLRRYLAGGEAHDSPSATDAIAAHLFEPLRGSDNLVFAGARKNVEIYADRLRERCEREGVPCQASPTREQPTRERPGRAPGPSRLQPDWLRC